jgi:pimeloyl-ACP methyl ester carboxylesterase
VLGALRDEATRGRFAATALAVLAIAVAGCESTGGDGSGGGRPESIAAAELHACGEQPVPRGWRCGSIEVPFERSDPSLGETKIGFAVRERDRDQRPSLGAIFAVEGGPGYASSGTANAYTKVFGSLLRRRELVLVDMRGTGRSQPIDCRDLQRGVGPEWITLSECARRLGPRFESYRTAAAADDINDVRRALGLGKISLYGDSYGTFLAQSYAFRHGDTLNALVLDSAYPARGETGWYPSLPRTQIRSMPKACERVETCSGDAAHRLEKLIDYLRETQRGVGPLLDALESAGTPQSFVKVDRAGVALRRGNSEPWIELTTYEKQGSGNPRSYVRAGELVVGCNDYPMIWDKSASEQERRTQLEEAIREHDPDTFAPFRPREIALSSNIGYLECLTWPAPTERYEPPVGPDAEPPDVPVLVVSGEFDSLTTVHEGEVVAEMFPDSEHFVARNVGHVDALYHEDGAAAREIRAFLRRELGDR